MGNTGPQDDASALIGPPGPEGPQGPKGDTGDTGPAASAPLSFPNETDGFTPSRWDDLRVSLLGANAGTLQPPSLTRVFRNNGTSEGVYAWGFPTNQERELIFDVQLPHTS